MQHGRRGTALKQSEIDDGYCSRSGGHNHVYDEDSACSRGTAATAPFPGRTAPIAGVMRPSAGADEVARPSSAKQKTDG